MEADGFQADTEDDDDDDFNDDEAVKVFRRQKVDESVKEAMKEKMSQEDLNELRSIYEKYR